MIPQNVIDEIFQTARIEEVVSDFVTLKKSGASFKGLSPWSNEKTPSFMVSPAKGIFKDFSSGKGGTVVTFLMEHEQMSYPESLRYLAKKYNIEIPEEKLSPEEEQDQKHRESLFKITEFASTFFEDELWNSEKGAAIGLSYFRERGFSDEIIKKFQLGFADDAFDSFLNKASEAGYKSELLLESGLIKQKEGSDHRYDAFRDRVVFPIQNVAGRCVGFGARILHSNTKAPKYLNSPENEIYNKSRVLYGLYQSRSEIVKADRCLLVEGYTDVISLFQAGVKNVVSSSGTALTEDQIRLIRRYSSNVTILYDGDEAGIKASFRGIDLVLKEGLNVKVLLFPEGEDPDSYARSHNSEELHSFIEEASEDFVYFKARVLGKQDMGDPQKRSQSIRDIVASIALIPDHISRSVYTTECSKLLNIAEQTLITEINKIRRREQGKKTRRSEAADPYFDPINLDDPFAEKQVVERFDAYHQEVDILRLIFSYYDQHIVLEENKELSVLELIIEDIEVDKLRFDDALNAEIYAQLKHDYHEYKSIQIQRFLNHEKEQVRVLVVGFLTDPYDLHNWTEKEIIVHHEKDKLKKAVLSSLYSFKARKVDLMIKDLQNKLGAKDLSDEEMLRLLKKKSSLDKVRVTIGDKLGRVIMHY